MKQESKEPFSSEIASRFLESSDSHGVNFSKSVLKTLRLSYADSKYFLFICIFIGFLGRLFLLANGNVIGYWVDHFCVPAENVPCRPLPPYFSDFSNLSFIKLMASITVIGFLLTWLFRIFFSSISAKAVSQIYDETTLRASRFPMGFFDKNPTGRIVTRFSSDYGNVFRLFGGPLAEFLSIIFDLAGMIILLAIASPFYLPAVVLIGSLNYLVYKSNRSSLIKVRRDLSRSRSPSIAHFSETAQGVSTIRSFNRQNAFSLRFAKLDSYFLQQKKKVVRKVMFFSFQMSSLTAGLFLITGATGYLLLQSGKVSVGSLGVAFGFITLSGNTVQMFFEWLTQFEEAMIGVERLDNYLQHPIEEGGALPASSLFPTGHWVLNKVKDYEAQTQKVSEKKAVGISFNNVWFRYGEDLPFILRGITFDIKPGERIGIVGRTGSGKSSIIQALFRLYPLSKGEILVDGKTVKLSNNETSPHRVLLETFRRSMGFISQDPILFRGSLLENLICESQYNKEQVLRVLEQVGLGEWANDEGLGLLIEEKGKNLSVGEKQLLCMARCLLQDVPIVIMDEATSSVDPKSEEIMVRATSEFFQDRTQIIIAHRLSTLQYCHRILWLQDGMIRMLDTPSQVLQVFNRSPLV